MGWRCLTKLKDMGMNHKTIILSGFADFDYAKTAIRLGVTDYLLKPITVDDMEKVLRKY